MADKVTTTYELKLEWLFQDGDTRVATLKNPKAEITTADITSLESLILDATAETPTPLLIGDKSQGAFRRINLVTRETKTTMDLDLGLS